MPRYTVDPGEPNDGPPPRSAQDRRRRSYRRENETDDAWAAAEGDGDAYDIDPASLAAGYDWSDDPVYGAARRRRSSPPTDTDLGPLPPEAERARRRVEGPRQERIQRRYDRSGLYPESPSFRRDSRLGPVSDGGYRAPTPRAPESRASRPARAPVPFIGVLVLVMLGMIALGSVILACVAVLFWL